MKCDGKIMILSPSDITARAEADNAHEIDGVSIGAWWLALQSDLTLEHPTLRIADQERWPYAAWRNMQ